jgi:bifunctional non-homologous end joining protein LigD
VIKDRSVELYSRNEIAFTTTYKTLVEELKKIKHEAVLDGEIVIEDKSGRSHFQLLQNYQRTRKGTIKYYVFDLLNLDGHDTRQLPLLERKELLNLLLSGQKLKNIFYSDHIETKGISFFNKAVKKKLEGIIAKDGNSVYRTGKRSSEWQKIKITQEEEAVIIGITEPRGSRKNFGALLLAQYEKGKLKYTGNCGTGFTEAVLHELYTKFKTVFTDRPPLTEKIQTREKIQWMRPKFICQVRFTEKTAEGSLRHPVFLGLRIDKKVKAVTTEKEQKRSAVHKKSRS